MNLGARTGKRPYPGFGGFIRGPNQLIRLKLVKIVLARGGLTHATMQTRIVGY